MMDKRSYIQPLVYSVLLCLGLVIGFFIPKEKTNKFSEVLSIVRNDYVDSVGEDLDDQMVARYLSSLDPHSVYIPKQYYTYSKESLQGNYKGIGLEFDVLFDEVYVTRVIPTGPASKTNISVGDQIIFANGVAFKDSVDAFSEVIEALRGGDRDTVSIHLKGKNGRVSKLKIERSSVPNGSIRAAFVHKDVAYIRLYRFSHNCHEEFSDALKELKKIGFSKLVLDLRNNGGGFLFEAQKMANEFLKEDDLIAFINGRKRKRKEFIADGKGSYQEGDLYVLIDGNSASASEILSGTLQEHDRATIIGRRSYGKGLVQESFYFSDSSSVKLTVARYYLPSGRSIQKNYTNLKDSLNGDTFYSLKEKRMLMDGNGVIPDIHYPSDTNSAMWVAMHSVKRSDRFEHFILREFEKKDLSKEEFVEQFTCEPTKLRGVLLRVQKEQQVVLPLDDAEFLEKVEQYLRNQVAYYHYGTESFYYSKMLSESWVSLLK